MPNRGARVARGRTDDLEQIFELRLRLEPYAVGLAVPRLTEAELDELDDLARRMHGAREARPTARISTGS